MGVFTELFSDIRGALAGERNVTSWSGLPSYLSGVAGFADSKYETYAREGYQKNALVFACIEELASSAAEPDMQARQAGKWIHQLDGGVSSAARLLALLKQPNPFMDHYEFWRTVILYRSLAGNAYGIKVRSRSGALREIWLPRPDHMSIVPDEETFIRRYEYRISATEVQRLPVEDVIHWKTPNPVDPYYGMPPLATVAGNIDLDNYARDFVKQYFERAGVPSAILTTKGKLTDDLKKEIKERIRSEHGGMGKWFGVLVLDGTDATYTPMTQSLGAQGLVYPELNEISESRIAMAFGVPLSLVGTLSGAGNSSYGNKESERKSFWNETLKPLYRELVGPLNRSLVNEYPGVQEVAFDLSTVGALLPDQDALHKRLRDDMIAGGIPIEEFRAGTGREPTIPPGTYLVPANLVATTAEQLKNPEPAPPEPVAAPSTNGAVPVGAGEGGEE